MAQKTFGENAALTTEREMTQFDPPVVGATVSSAATLPLEWPPERLSTTLLLSIASTWSRPRMHVSDWVTQAPVPKVQGRLGESMWHLGFCGGSWALTRFGTHSSGALEPVSKSEGHS